MGHVLVAVAKIPDRVQTTPTSPAFPLCLSWEHSHSHSFPKHVPVVPYWGAERTEEVGVLSHALITPGWNFTTPRHVTPDKQKMYTVHESTRLEAISIRLEAISIRLEAISIGLEAISIRLEAISINEIGCLPTSPTSTPRSRPFASLEEENERHTEGPEGPGSRSLAPPKPVDGFLAWLGPNR